MEYLERLETAITAFENEADKVSKIPELLNNIVRLIEEVQQEKKEAEENHNKVKELELLIGKETEKLSEMIAAEKQTKEEAVAEMRKVLLEGLRECMNIYGGISSVVENKVSVAENNLHTAIVQGTRKITDESARVEEKIEDINKNLMLVKSSTEEIAEIRKEINESVLPKINKLQIMAGICLVLGIISCVIGIVL